MKINGEKTCLICNMEFKWMGIITESSISTYSIRSEVKADIEAIGQVATNDGRSIRLSVVAICPKCKNKNRFEVTAIGPFK